MNTNISNFVHLHVHTQYSLLDGAIRINDLFNKVKGYGMEAVAITDHGTMFGVIDFYRKAIQFGVKPIIGCECYLAPRAISNKTPTDRANTSHIVLLAKNKKGYENLCQLASIAQLKGFYYKPRIDKDILARYSEGLICLSACLKGEIPQLILSGNISKAKQIAVTYLNLFGENNFFLELQNNGIRIQDKINLGLIELGRELSIPLVATNDCHYLEPVDAKAHEVLLCIQTQKTINDPDRFVFDSNQLYLKSAEEMIKSFGNSSEAVENTVKIANLCDIDIDFKKYHFPKYTNNLDKDVDDIFSDQVHSGYLKRLETIKAFENNHFDQRAYDHRLEHEIKMIKEMGFSGYFLIVADFVRYAKENKISVGPGRGSAAGSLVSYSLNITDLDPITHGLIFERFLNPARLSMPDIDVDFCIHGRDRVYNYVVDRYGGGDYVAQIITFGTMKARMVIRDVGKALGISLSEVDFIAKLIPEEAGITVDNALKAEPRLREKIKSDANLIELIKIARALEGLFRHASTHAAGVVISDKPLVKYLPLYRGKKGETVTQFDMKSVENIGLVKFDFLGLKNLTVIDDTLKIIEKQERSVPNLSLLDLKDSMTYKLLQCGDTTGVFQLESSGMKGLMTRLKPEKFDEIIALVALYRPGPLDSGMVTDFVERKHGREKVEYIVPAIEPILSETYGVIIYQEQVMQVAVELAGYSMEDADSLRKAIGKKIPSLMVRHREKFISGAVKKKMDVNKATELFELIQKFGGYGFNKSHSAAYALIAYHTAYLKAHYLVEFMASLLTNELDNIEGIVKFIAECRNHNIEVLPPDINKSYKKFTVDSGKIRFGLVAIKNIGPTAVESIVEERQKRGFFKSIFDFCQRVDLSKINKRIFEALICCGAMDFMRIGRSKLLAVLEDVLDYGHRFQRERNSDQISLFDSNKAEYSNLNQPVIPDVPGWSNIRTLKFEKEYIGLYLTGHPLDEYAGILKRFTSVDTLSLKRKENKDLVRIGGIIDNVKIVRTKKGDSMAFVLLGDTSGRTEIVVFPTLYSKHSKLLIKDKILFFQGKTGNENGAVKIIADSISEANDVAENWRVTLHFMIDAEVINRNTLREVYKTIMIYPGPSNGFVHIKIKNKGEAIVSISESIGIRCCEEMISQVNNLLGYNGVEIEQFYSE